MEKEGWNALPALERLKNLLQLFIRLSPWFPPGAFILHACNKFGTELYCMLNVPVSFKIDGKLQNGTLEPVYGAGAKVWHLMVNKFYWGRLRFTDRWEFDPAKHESLKDLAAFFGDSLLNQFYITLRHNYKNYKVLVVRTKVTKTAEQYSVIGRTKTVVVENNRPTWVSMMVRHRMEWSKVSGDLPYNSNYNDIYMAIEDYIKQVTGK
ncbi:MAG: hypothetical protein QM791_23740 [Ferruginibacter sp.]